MEPKISVIIPVYNAEHYLGKCLESVCSQTFKELEVIVINDGSTDESQQIIDQFREKDPRIKSVQKENSGVSDTRNIGIEKASGKYIAFIDSDDWIEPNMYESMYNAMEYQSADLVTCGFYLNLPYKTKAEKGIEDESFHLNEMGLDQFLLEKLGVISVVPWNKLYRKDIILNHHLRFLPRSHVYSEDFLFVLCYTLFCNHIITMKNPLYHYVIREGSLMNSLDTGQHQRLVNLAVEFNRFAEIYHKDNDVQLFKNAIMLEITSRSLFKVRDSQKQLQKILKEMDENPAFKRKLTAIVKNDFPINAKLKAGVCLIKPYWFAAVIIRGLFLIKYRQ